MLSVAGMFLQQLSHGLSGSEYFIRNVVQNHLLFFLLLLVIIIVIKVAVAAAVVVVVMSVVAAAVVVEAATTAAAFAVAAFAATATATANAVELPFRFSCDLVSETNLFDFYEFQHRSPLETVVEEV